jgi:preprotein translocase subunit SecF
LVIFDRIRENKRAFNTKLTTEELINKSIGQSLTRTINTTMMSLIAIVLVFAFGAAQGLTSIVNFALPMMVGILSGCYSSSFLAPFIWCDLQKLKKKK